MCHGTNNKDNRNSIQRPNSTTSSGYFIVLIYIFGITYVIPEDVKQELNPQQIHVAFGRSSRDLVIIWTTSSGIDCHVQTNFSAKIVTKRHFIPENRRSTLNFLHRAEVNDLDPGFTLRINIICEEHGSKSISETLEVKMPTESNKQIFMIVADLGLKPLRMFQFVGHEILNGNYDAVFHIGDIAYDLSSSGDEYMRQAQLFTSRVPYMTTPGDHEWEAERLGADSEYFEYRHRFSMPGVPWPMPRSHLWYSLDIGIVHFISINTGDLLRSSIHTDTQLTWLRQDLAKANHQRQQQPWIIMLGHQPIYCSASSMYADCAQKDSMLRKVLEDVIYEGGVDLYISGHQHRYERTWPTYGSQAFQTDYFNPLAPVYITNGAMGYNYMIDTVLSKHYWLPVSISDGKHLFGRLSILNSSNLVYSAHAAETNQEVDRVHIIQNKHSSFGKAGSEAFRKVEFIHSRREEESFLPPEPFHIIDSPNLNVPRYRTYALYILVSLLTMLLLVVLSHSKMRRIIFKL